MNETIIDKAIREIVTNCEPKVFEALMERFIPDLSGLTHISMPRGAGMLEMNTQAFTRLCEDHGLLVDFGLRHKRISLSDFRTLCETMKRKTESRRKKARKAQDATGELGLTI